MSRDPAAYLAFILDLLQKEHFDVLLPVHEHGLLFSKAVAAISCSTHCAVASFTSFDRVQSKAAFIGLLDELDLPHPSTRLVTQPAEIEACHRYPFYIKTAYGTAGFGTWRVDDEQDKCRAVRALEEHGAFNTTAPVLIQEAAPGVLEVVQGVFDRGHLVAAHCYRQTAVGVGGSAAARVGIKQPLVIQHLMKMGAALNWHGSLMIDYLYEESTGRIAYIDPNPRMGETMNAVFNGVNIPDLMVRLSLGKELPLADGRKQPPVQSHILISMLLGKAFQNPTRPALLNELLAACFRTGRYRDSREDFSDPFRDFLSPIPLLIVFLRLLIHPQSAQKIAAGAVQNYALTLPAVEQIRVLPFE